MKYKTQCGPLRSMIIPVFLVFSMSAFSTDVDCTALTFSESVAGVSDDCPAWIVDNQVLIDVVYWDYDGVLQKGQLVADARVAGDLHLVFMQMLAIGFPLQSVIPICEFGWDDDESMRCNNTSAFNYRCVPGTDRLSRHALGLAIDINPVQNPYYSGGSVSPEGALYDPSVPGTLYDGHPVVELFRILGWRWGGDWSEKDYQHFDKRLDEIELSDIQHHRSWPQWRLL